VHSIRRSLSVLALAGLLSVGVVPTAFAVEVEAPEVVDAEVALDTELSPAASADSDRTPVIEAPIAFTSLWAELPDGVDAIQVRTSIDGQAWSAWTELATPDELDAPDPGSPEAVAASGAARVTDLLEAGEARFVQVEAAEARVDEIVLQLVDTAGLNESVIARIGRHLTARPAPADAAENSSVPTWVEARSAWGAAPYKGTPSVAKYGVEQVILHHTAGSNKLRRWDGTCVRSEIISTIRGIQKYHQDAKGWSDIGYNVVIDPCGGVWEARQGGLDRAVIGAHAAGANANSTGISVLGNFNDLDPNADILAAFDRVVGWKAGIHGIDTTGSVTRTIKGVTKVHPTVIGHSDVGSTSCPGRIMNSITRIRTNAKAEAGNWPRVPDDVQRVPDERPAITFSDITGNTHAAAIEALVGREITTGYSDGTYRPGLQVTRAQVATFLMRALGLEPVPGVRFTDVAAGNVHAPAINALVDAGVLNGYAGNSFRPDESLRREHMAVVIARALELAPNPVAAERFSDVVGYEGDIGALAEAAITTGYPDGTFRPKATVSRDQMATFLMNAVRILDERAAPAPAPAPEPEPAPAPAPDPDVTS
jgi:hypothetical protein